MLAQCCSLVLTQRSAVLASRNMPIAPLDSEDITEPMRSAQLVSGHVMKQRQFLSNLGASDSGAAVHSDCSI